jgi:hypothetical protein
VKRHARTRKNFALLVVLVTLVFGISEFLAGIISGIFITESFEIYPAISYVALFAVVGGIVFAAAGLGIWRWLWRKINFQTRMAFSIVLVCLAFDLIKIFFKVISHEI